MGMSVETTARGIPRSLSPFFQEYCLDEMDPEGARWTIIERTLRYGNRAELRWLFRRYSEPVIADWVRVWGVGTLLEAHLAFWRLLLERDSLRVGFFGYGYCLLEPTFPAGGVPLAGLVDVGLMKLDALATRSSRKDFYDLYAIAQHISLRQLLDRAPEKYPGFRDFEAMVVRRLAYFQRAEQEETPEVLQPVSWDTVKAFFRRQAVVLGREWLE
jgi:hypothetical protein